MQASARSAECSVILSKFAPQSAQAVSLFSVANSLDPTNATVWAKLALACIRTGRLVAAKQATNFAGQPDTLSGDTINTRIGIELIEACLQTERRPLRYGICPSSVPFFPLSLEAISLCQRLLEAGNLSEEQEGNLHFLLGRGLFLKGDFKVGRPLSSHRGFQRRRDECVALWRNMKMGQDDFGPAIGKN